MIKLRQVSTENSETVLTFDYDQDGKTHTVKLAYNDVRERLRRIREFQDRMFTVQDVKLVIVKIINEIRMNKMPLLERFDLSQLVGVDLES
jgi:hypothetical protein